MTACREVGPFMEPYVDGELEPAQVAMVEQHLLGCEGCHERVKVGEALRATIRRAVRTSAEPSEAFVSRIRSAMAAERERETHEERAKPSPLGWGVIGPLAAAAAVALSFGMWRSWGAVPSKAPTETESQKASMDVAQDISARVEAELDQLVENHARGPAPQFTQLSMVKQMEPEIGVPLRPPSLLEYGAEFRGGSMVALKGRQAASLSYDFPDGHRLTVYVYDAKKVPLRTALEARVVQNAPVYVGVRRGYSIAAVEKRGVGYALAADMDDRQSAELIVRSVSHSVY